MIVIKVVLIVIGALALVASYFLESEDAQEITPESVNGLSRILEEQADYASGRLNESVVKTLDKAEDDLSRLSCKKINEFNEFSEQVMAKIAVNHKEVMFVYDMLNEKDKEVKETIGRLEDVKHEVTELTRKLNQAAENVSKEALEAENMISITQNIEKIRDQIVGEINKNMIEDEKSTKKSTTKKTTVRSTSKKSTTKTATKEDIAVDTDDKKSTDATAKTVASATTTKAADKATTKATTKAADKATTKATTKAADKATTKATTKAADKATTKATTKAADKATTKATTKTAAKTTKKATKTVDSKEKYSDTGDEADERYKNIQGEVLEYQNANDQILQLHEEGLSYIEISKKLELGVGEVMLVINLYKNKVSK